MIEINVQPYVNVQMSEDDAKLFLMFQEKYQVLAHLLGCMEGLQLQDLKNVSVVMDIDGNGKLQHTAITKHYR